MTEFVDDLDRMLKEVQWNLLPSFLSGYEKRSEQCRKTTVVRWWVSDFYGSQ